MRIRTLTLSLLLAFVFFIGVLQAPAIAPILVPVPPTENSDTTRTETLPALELSGAASIVIGQPLAALEADEPPAETITTIESKPAVITYTVKRGDTLEEIAHRSGKTSGALMQLNGIRNADRIFVGQMLRLGTTNTPPKQIITHAGPADALLPDSEIVYSPAYKNFDISAVASNSGGYLNSYQEYVEGRMRTGPEIIQLLADEFSVGPRVLLTLLELKSGWLTKNSADLNNNPYPMGYRQPGWEGLYRQTFWVAERINAAFYLSNQNQLKTLSLFDGDQIRLAPKLNPGTIAVQNVIARSGTWETFNEQVTNGDFAATYKWLFGAPEQYAIGDIIPENVTQPLFRLPWEDNHTWWLTGGPHNGWAEGSAWAALDFAPSATMGTCRVSPEWDVAVAPGKVIEAENGRVIVDLDGDGFQGTGWTLLYMHVAAKDRVAVGTVVNTGDHIGHPSCEGGIATGTHLHIARMFNGEWIRADDPRLPFDLNGWSVEVTNTQYDGIAVKGNERREACGCRDETLNGIQAIPGMNVTVAFSKNERDDTSMLSTVNNSANGGAMPVNKPGLDPVAKPVSSSGTEPLGKPDRTP